MSRYNKNSKDEALTKLTKKQQQLEKTIKKQQLIEELTIDFN